MEIRDSNLLERDEEWVWAHFSSNRSGLCSETNLAFKDLNLCYLLQSLSSNKMVQEWFKECGNFLDFYLFLFFTLDFDLAREERDAEEREAVDEEVDGTSPGGNLVGH